MESIFELSEDTVVDITERSINCCLCMLSCSVVSDSVTPWTVTHQAPLSIGFLRQEYWSGLLFPSPINCWWYSNDCPRLQNFRLSVFHICRPPTKVHGRALVKSLNPSLNDNLHVKYKAWNFPGGPVLRLHTPSARCLGSIPGRTLDPNFKILKILSLCN